MLQGQVCTYDYLSPPRASGHTWGEKCQRFFLLSFEQISARSTLLTRPSVSYCAHAKPRRMGAGTFFYPAGSLFSICLLLECDNFFLRPHRGSAHPLCPISIVVRWRNKLAIIHHAFARIAVVQCHLSLSLLWLEANAIAVSREKKLSVLSRKKIEPTKCCPFTAVRKIRVYWTCEQSLLRGCSKGEDSANFDDRSVWWNKSGKIRKSRSQ